MSDYEKLKVTELKTLLKERGIAGSGITKKAQYIQALEEDDDAKTGDTAPAPEEHAAEQVKQPEVASEQDDNAGDNEDVKDEVMQETPAPVAEPQQTKEEPQEPVERKRKREDEQAEESTKKFKDDSSNGNGSIPPSRHEPTNALYIRNLMRPLQLSMFKEYLSSIVDGEVTDAFLDGMKTHAFATFSSVSAAEKVRAHLHDRVWPEESQRKALWVDFVPERSVDLWTSEESRAGREARFEVVYSGEDGNGTATLNEIGGRTAPPQSDAPAATSGQGMPGAPQGPRGQRQQDYAQDDQYAEEQPEAEARPPQQSGGGGSFNKLDQYFSSTTTKPKIYFKPVDDELANRRHEEFDRETAKEWQGGRAWNRTTRLSPIDQLRRYTFEDGDRIVDGGADFGGFGKRQFAGGTGPFVPGGPPRGRGGRGGGGYRGGY